MGNSTTQVYKKFHGQTAKQTVIHSYKIFDWFKAFDLEHAQLDYLTALLGYPDLVFAKFNYSVKIMGGGLTILFFGYHMCLQYITYKIILL